MRCEQVVADSLRVLAGPVNLARVVPQGLDPISDVRGVAAGIVPQFQAVARDHRTDLRAQLLAGVWLGTEPVAGALDQGGPVEAARMARPVAEFVQRGLVVGRSAREPLLVGQQDPIELQVEAGPAVAGVLDPGAAGREHAVGGFDADPVGLGRGRGRQAIALLRIEYRVAKHLRRSERLHLDLLPPLAVRYRASIRIHQLALDLEPPVQDRHTLLAAPYAAVHVPDLLEGAPALVGVAALVRRGRKVDRVHAAIRLAGLHVAGQLARAGLPRLRPRSRAAFDLRDQPVGHFAVVVVDLGAAVTAGHGRPRRRSRPDPRQPRRPRRRRCCRRDPRRRRRRCPSRLRQSRRRPARDRPRPASLPGA